MGNLVVENLTVNYGPKTVVKNCSFELEAGEILVVLGASGDGKTTLLKTLAGELNRAKGSIQFNGGKVLDPSEQLVPGHDSIKLVNQDFNLQDFLTVEENIRAKLLAFDNAYKSERIKKLLRVTKLTSYKDDKAIELSGGQRQRLAIARALADEPDLVLLDEPFNQLDFQTKSSISEHIRKYLRSNGISAVMVTHNGLEALEWADRIMYMEKGKMVRIDDASKFYNKYKTIKEARFFGPVNKVIVGGEIHYFRPSFYSAKQTKEYTIELVLKFKRKQHLGWYSAYYFNCNNHKIVLYSSIDISEFDKIYIKTLEKID